MITLILKLSALVNHSRESSVLAIQPGKYFFYTGIYKATAPTLPVNMIMNYLVSI